MTGERTGSLADALGVAGAEVVSLVGGGGKTTTLARLTGELRARGLRALATTTTKVGVPGPADPLRLHCAATYARARALAARVAAAQDPGSGVPVLVRRQLSAEKAAGVPAAWLEQLWALALLDALVVEADGAARKPVKAPAPWEPVVPHCTTVFVAVLGLSCLGEVVAQAGFRVEHIVACTGLAPDSRFEPAGLARLLTAPAGLAKGWGGGARAVAFLNQAEGEQRRAAAREVARRVLSQGPYTRVVVGSAAGETPLEVWTP